jgi:hypothetical protein
MVLADKRSLRERNTRSTTPSVVTGSTKQFHPRMPITTVTHIIATALHHGRHARFVEVQAEILVNVVNMVQEAVAAPKNGTGQQLPSYFILYYGAKNALSAELSCERASRAESELWSRFALTE